MRPRWRKRPLVIDAVRVSEALRDAAYNWANLPPWLSAAYERAEVVFASDSIHIKTREGTMIGSYDDWILCGVKGELYPCAHDIFLHTYEPVWPHQVTP